MSKPRPNHRLYVETLRRMTPEQRLAKSFELTETSRALFREGLRRRFSEMPEAELQKLYVDRLLKCRNSDC